MKLSTGFACGLNSLCNISLDLCVVFIMLDPSTCDNVPFYYLLCTIIYYIQVLASKLLQACLCDLRLRRSPSDYNSTLLICVWFINAIQVHVTYPYS